jgi:predicted SAM-dependent methyltransferase
MMKLNLASGRDYREGWVNVDFNGKCDLKHDLTNPLPYEDNSVDEILAAHILEHFGFGEYMDVLTDWVRVLKPGGKMTILVPDMDMIAWLWHEQPERRFKHFGVTSWLAVIYGGQFDKGQLHKMGFNEESLTTDLESVGMKIVSTRTDIGLTLVEIPELEVICTKL